MCSDIFVTLKSYVFCNRMNGVIGSVMEVRLEQEAVGGM